MPRSPANKFAHWQSVVVLISLATIFCLLWAGCGHIEQSMRNNYGFWNRFIDGIPDPNAPKAEGLAYGGADRESYIQHAPFAANSCTECHRNPTQSRLTINDGQICLKCHEAETTKYARMHGPVASAACLWCHDPHSSPLPYLTKAPTPDLCLQCHADEDSEGPHANQMKTTRSCLDCHSGHGGESAYFLLPDAVLPPLLNEIIEPTADLEDEGPDQTGSTSSKARTESTSIKAGGTGR